MTMVRAFIALTVPPLPAWEHHRQWLRSQGSALRVVEPGQLHLTLRFLGAVEVAYLPRLAAGLPRVAARHAALTLTWRGVGAFPDIQRPAVIWVGLQDDPAADALAHLAQDIRAWTEAEGFGGDVRPWAGHLTLARVKRRPPAALREFLLREAHAVWGETRHDHVTLMTSRLTPAGAIYHEVAVAPLCATG